MVYVLHIKDLIHLGKSSNASSLGLGFTKRSWLHKSIGHPCVHGKPNPAPEPTGLHLEGNMYLLHNCLIWVFLEANEQCQPLWLDFPILEGFSGGCHTSAVVPLGLHQGGWRRTTPLALHLTPLLPGSSKHSLITNWQHLPCQRGHVGSIKCSPRRVEVTKLPAHLDTSSCNVLGNVQGHLGIRCFLLAQHRGDAQDKSNGSSRRGTNRAQQALWYSILHWCLLLKSFFPKSDGAAWNLQIAGASLKHAAWGGRGWCLLALTVPETGGAAWGQGRWGNPLYSTTVSSSLLNTCLFCTQVVGRRQQRFTTVCPDCVNSPDMIQKPKPTMCSLFSFLIIPLKKGISFTSVDWNFYSGKIGVVMSCKS